MGNRIYIERLSVKNLDSERKSSFGFRMLDDDNDYLNANYETSEELPEKPLDFFKWLCRSRGNFNQQANDMIMFASENGAYVCEEWMDNEELETIYEEATEYCDCGQLKTNFRQIIIGNPANLNDLQVYGCRICDAIKPQD